MDHAFLMAVMHRVTNIREQSQPLARVELLLLCGNSSAVCKMLAGEERPFAGLKLGSQGGGDGFGRILSAQVQRAVGGAFSVSPTSAPVTWVWGFFGVGNGFPAAENAVSQGMRANIVTNLF